MTAFEKFCSLLDKNQGGAVHQVGVPIALARELRKQVETLLTEKHAGKFELFDTDDSDLVSLQFANLSRFKAVEQKVFEETGMQTRAGMAEAQS